MLSMSSGLMSLSPFPISVPGFQKSLLLLPVFLSSEAPVVLSIGTPSTTIRGWLLPERELLPRRTILEDEPGPLAPLRICIPETLPERALVMLGSRTAIRASPRTSCMAYPSALRSRRIPRAVTTTLLRVVVASSRTIVSGVPVQRTLWLR